MNISNLFLENHYDTDKYLLGYLDHFYDLEMPLLSAPDSRFLEIGCDTGGSLRLWRDYFPDNVSIYGLDIRDFAVCPGVTKIIGNAYTEGVVDSFRDNFFDVVIDDGPHTFASFEVAITKYYSKLKSGGVLIIEDVIHSCNPFVRPQLNMGATDSQREHLLRLGEDICFVQAKEFNLTGKQKDRSLLAKWQSGLYILKFTK